MALSTRLRLLLGCTPAIVLLHGLEEYWMGLSSGTSADMIGSTSLLPVFVSLNQEQAIYIVYIALLFLLCLTIALLLSEARKAKLVVLTMLGLYFLYQTHHLVEAIAFLRYNPGLISSFLYVGLGVFYWKELIALFSSSPSATHRPPGARLP